MVQLVCQVLVGMAVVTFFLTHLWFDFNPREARPPSGYTGAIASVIAALIQVVVLYQAGAFSRLVP